MFARAIGDDALLPMHPFPARELRARLGGHGDGLAALDRLEAARDGAALASPEAVALALDELDRVFEELSGHATDAGHPRSAAVVRMPRGPALQW